VVTDNATADEIMGAALLILKSYRDDLSMLMTCSLAPGAAGGLELFAPGGAVYDAVSRAGSPVARAVAEAAEAHGIPASELSVRVF
jgi:hypothetical protein